MTRKRKTNKNIVIILLLILLIAIGTGYAIFSDTLIISGTATVSGILDLQFQNPQIVNFAGVDEANITVKLSEDSNNLTVGATDLQYPGAGVEFSVDIVNVGNLPAKVNEVGTMVSDYNHYHSVLKINGLDLIKTEHPIIQPNEKCNIHFTIEWPKEATEPINDNGNIMFELEIEYTQATDEMFSGKTSHTHEEGGISTPEYEIPNNLVANAGQSLSEIESQLPAGFKFQDDLATSVGDNAGIVKFKATYIPEDTESYNTVKDIDIPINVLKTGNLAQIIKGTDYGKNIDYSVTVNDVELKDWKIFSNNGTNVKIIIDKYLPHEAIPKAVFDLGLEKVTGTKYSVNTDAQKVRDIHTLMNALKNGWEELAGSIPGATATGTPTYEELMESMSAMSNIEMELSERDRYMKLYWPYNTVRQNNYNLEGYWLATNDDDYTALCYGVNGGYFAYRNSPLWGVRPIITLPTDLVGTVGESIEISK